MAIQKNRYWSFILYPESAPADWQTILESTGLPIAISPLHDKDHNPNDEIKKAHYHVILAWEGPTTAKVAGSISSLVNGVVPNPIASVKGMYDYHIHKNNPEKYQYNDADRILINGFNIYNYAALTTEEDILLKKQIFNYIVQNDINEYFILCSRLMNEDLIMFDFITKHTILVDRFICSRRNFIKTEINDFIDKE